MITDDESRYAAELDMISVVTNDDSNMCFAQRHFFRKPFGKPVDGELQPSQKSYLKLLPISLITRSISVTVAAVSSSEDFFCMLQVCSI